MPGIKIVWLVILDHAWNNTIRINILRPALYLAPKGETRNKVFVISISSSIY